jgi:hypothetical protein
MSSIGTTCALPPPGGPALHPEVRAKRRLADADHRLLADAVQPVAKTHGRRRLALARRRRVDRRHEDQLAVRAGRQACDEFLPDLRLVVAVGQQRLRRDAEFGADLLDRFLLRGARDFDVCLEGHDLRLPSASVSWVHSPIAGVGTPNRTDCDTSTDLPATWVSDRK